MIDNDIHIYDLLAKREKGESTATRFLNESEKALASKELQTLGEDFRIFGGYGECIRARIVFPAFWETDSIDASEYVTSVKIVGSGYETLTHSDFLGSVLGLGISRNAVGDIVVEKEKTSAVVFCTPEIKSFLLSAPPVLERVGRDTVRVIDYTPGEDFTSGHGFESKTVLAASLRLDCIVSSLCNVSRENAKVMISQEKVSLNYVSALKCDAGVSAGDIISVRGKGKFRIDEASGNTKKGKIRLQISKYI